MWQSAVCDSAALSVVSKGNWSQQLASTQSFCEPTGQRQIAFPYNACHHPIPAFDYVTVFQEAVVYSCTRVNPPYFNKWSVIILYHLFWRSCPTEPSSFVLDQVFHDLPSRKHNSILTVCLRLIYVYIYIYDDTYLDLHSNIWKNKWCKWI